MIRNILIRKIKTEMIPWILMLSMIMAGFLPLSYKVEAASKTVNGFDFIFCLVEGMIGLQNGDKNQEENGQYIVSRDKKGIYTVNGTVISEKQYKKYISSYGLSGEKAAAFVAAKKLGIVNDKPKNYKKAITVAKALGLVSRADELLNGIKVSTDAISYCIKNRIADIGKVKKGEQALEAEGYIRGFIKGSAEKYSHVRTLKGHKKLTKSTSGKLLELLFDAEKRYTLSPDFEITRNTKLPKNAELYPYIVDSFPNSYYETGFNGMYTEDFFESGIGAGTLEERMQRKSFCFVFPNEIERFNSLEYPGDAFPYENNTFYAVYRNNIVPYEMVTSSEEFYKYALNVDYRTLENDEEWLRVMKKYLSDVEIADYIRHCKENKTVLECDLVAADRSSVYWYNGEYQCKVYAHMRVVSDIPTELGKTMGTDQEIYGYLYPVKKGYEAGTCFTRSVLGPLYLDYQMGEWLDYYVNTSGCADFYGSLCCTNTERGIMIDYSGLYPWLIEFPFRNR